MPIKEEPIRIEFQYEQEGTENAKFNVEYFSEMEEDKEKKYLRVSASFAPEESHVFEVDFFVEVVDFLRKKGVVEEVVPEGTVARPGLPLPNIQTAPSHIEMPNSGMLSPPVVEKAPMFITSAHGHGPSSTPLADDSPSQIFVPNVDSIAKTVPIIISADTADESSIIRRPVIRTEVGANEDPMKSLIDSKRQRAVNPAKAIKRREE
jgi:hypothetical protein